MPLKMFDPAIDQPLEPTPSWSRARPPRLPEIRRGVLYVGLDADAVSPIVAAVNGRFAAGNFPVSAFAAIGPSLFFGRVGPFITHDFEAYDENRQMKVYERGWPFNWGDIVWAACSWLHQPTFIRWDVDGFSDLYVGTWGDEGTNPPALAAWLARAVLAETGERRAITVEARFWRRKRAERFAGDTTP